jgi:cytochrome P450
MSTADTLPPGPGLIATADFLRNPLRFLDRCAQRFGDWFSVRVPGVTTFVFTSEPAAIRDVFIGDPEILQAGEANRPLGAFMGERSVLFLDGAAHLKERRLVTPAFHGERMRNYTDTIRAAAVRAIESWQIGIEFPIHPEMRAITFDVMIRAVFGLEDGREAAHIGGLLVRLFALYTSRIGALFALPAFQVDLGLLSPWGCAMRINRELNTRLFAEFKRRRDEGASGREDILSHLLAARDEAGAAMSDESLRDEMLTLVLAGHETTAATLAWVMNRLLSNPDIMKRARSEVRTVLDGETLRATHIDQLRFLEAVVNETMRLDPVVPNVARLLKAPARIGGRRLPADIAVAPCIYLAHRRADLWSDPERFDPERFLDARPAASTFFPFGGGSRRCIGAAFAMHQMKTVLAEILATVEIEAVANYQARPVRCSIAFAPSKGMPVRATRRLE